MVNPQARMTAVGRERRVGITNFGLISDKLNESYPVEEWESEKLEFQNLTTETSADN